MKAKFVRQLYYCGLVLFFVAAAGTAFARPVILPPPAPDINGPDILACAPARRCFARFQPPANGQSPFPQPISRPA
jgi:hypothetical protein